MSSAAISDFWAAQGEAPAPGFAEPQRRWRQLIEQSQHPSRCTRLCSCGSQGDGDAAQVEEEGRSVGGMFSTLHAVGVCVIAAALEGCALVGSTAPWMATYTTSAALKAECAADGVGPGMPCYFQPLSHCTLADARAAAAGAAAAAAAGGGEGAAARVRLADGVTATSADGGVGRGLLKNVLRRNQQDHLRLNPLLTEAARRTNLTSDLLLISSAVAWALRPRAPLSDAVATHGARLGLVGDAGARSVAMHVRHGDKPANSARALGAAGRVHMRCISPWALEPTAYSCRAPAPADNPHDVPHALFTCSPVDTRTHTYTRAQRGACLPRASSFGGGASRR